MLHSGGGGGSECCTVEGVGGGGSECCTVEGVVVVSAAQWRGWGG